VGEYVIIYRIQDDGVSILRVVRGSRNIEALFGQ
jgi:plasmid stabilization system protein ParE